MSFHVQRVFPILVLTCHLLEHGLIVYLQLLQTILCILYIN